MNEKILHATAVAINGNGVLLTGPSGSGKSDLALRLIDRGAILISDDAVAVDVSDGLPMLTPGPNIEGKLELRGVGICAINHISSAPLRLVVELTDDVERMPAADKTANVSEYDTPVIQLASFEVSAAVKLEYALRTIVDASRWPVARYRSNTAEGQLI
jgi:HPr kinase/phosphorylase